MKTLLELLAENNHYCNDPKQKVDRWNGWGMGTDKEVSHQYCSLFYQEHFQPYQDKPITLIEIGLCTGASLLLWKDFFVNADIHGIDITNRQWLPGLTQDRITTYHFNGYEKQNADQLPNADIIIDDGPHHRDSWTSCLELYLPKLNYGGLLVIEDINDFEFTTVLADKVKDYKHQVFDFRNTPYPDGLDLGMWGNRQVSRPVVPTDSVMLAVWK